jgi:hypothetical protein
MRIKATLYKDGKTQEVCGELSSRMLRGGAIVWNLLGWETDEDQTVIGFFEATTISELDWMCSEAGITDIRPCAT